MYNLKAILAVTEDFAVGKDNKLPWKRQKRDMEHFKNYTMGKTCIVGRKTFEGIGELKGRKFYVVTRTPEKYEDTENVKYGRLENIPLEGVVIGGPEIYKSLLPLCKEISLTTFDVKGLDADTYFDPTRILKRMKKKKEKVFFTRELGQFDGKIQLYVQKG